MLVATPTSFVIFLQVLARGDDISVMTGPRPTRANQGQPGPRVPGLEQPGPATLLVPARGNKCLPDPARTSQDQHIAQDCKKKSITPMQRVEKALSLVLRLGMVSTHHMGTLGHIFSEKMSNTGHLRYSTWVASR